MDQDFLDRQWQLDLPGGNSKFSQVAAPRSRINLRALDQGRVLDPDSDPCQIDISTDTDYRLLWWPWVSWWYRLWCVLWEVPHGQNKLRILLYIWFLRNLLYKSNLKREFSLNFFTVCPRSLSIEWVRSRCIFALVISYRKYPRTSDSLSMWFFGF